MFPKTTSLVILILSLFTTSVFAEYAEWVNSKTYNAGDSISYNGSCYVAIRDVFQNTPPIDDWFWNELEQCRDGSGDSVVTEPIRFRNDIILENGAKLIVRDSSSIIVENSMGPFTIDGNAITINSRGSKMVITHGGIEVERGDQRINISDTGIVILGDSVQVPLKILYDRIQCNRVGTMNAYVGNDLIADDIAAQRIEVRPVTPPVQ